jgi:hypothetical protein
MACRAAWTTWPAAMSSPFTVRPESWSLTVGCTPLRAILVSPHVALPNRLQDFGHNPRGLAGWIVHAEEAVDEALRRLSLPQILSK